MALEFDGTSQYVITNSDLGITGGVITLSIWVKLNAEISSGEWCFVSQIDAGTHVKYAIDYKYNSGTRQLSFYRTRYGIVDNQATYNITLGTSNWYHLVLTYDGSNVIGYVNGVLQAGPTASSGNGINRGSDCFVVASEDGAGLYANATLFDARCYNRALSANEIAEIYHKRGADRVWQGLVGRWRLDELIPAPLLIDPLDSSAGWTVTNGLFTENTTTYKEGGKALNVIKTTTEVTGWRAGKSINSLNLTNQTIKWWVYVKDTTTLNKITNVRLFLGTTDWGDMLRAAWTGLSVGWNDLSKHIDDFTVASGTPDKSAITFIMTYLTTAKATDTTAAGDLIYDFVRTGDYPSSIYDLSGNGNHGTPNNSPIYQDSPHRLRRGVLVS